MRPYLVLLYSALLCAHNAPCVTSLATSKPALATIRVCTGADCRVDGSTDCLRSIQQHELIQRAKDFNQDNANDARAIQVVSCPCVGPCGDGPNVVVWDRNGQRIVEPREFKAPKSLVPPDAFGDSSRGVYQVRTQDDVNFVAQLAARSAGMDTTLSANIDAPTDTIIVTPSRPWYDRPRNERKVMQRLMQFLVAVGLCDQYQTYGMIEEEQWRIAIALFVLSNFMTNENLLSQAFTKITRSIKVN
jgi:hypothetical protein